MTTTDRDVTRARAARPRGCCCGVDQPGQQPDQVSLHEQPGGDWRVVGATIALTLAL